MKEGLSQESEKQSKISELMKEYPKGAHFKHVIEEYGAVEIIGFYLRDSDKEIIAKVNVKSYDRKEGEVVLREGVIWELKKFLDTIKRYRLSEEPFESEPEDEKKGLEMEKYKADAVKEEIEAELRSGIPLTWSEFRKRFKEHQHLISRDKDKRESYFNEQGRELIFFKYDEITGKVYVFSSDFEKGRKAQEVSIEGFENMLKLYFPKKVAEERWGIKVDESETEEKKEGAKEDDDVKKKEKDLKKQKGLILPIEEEKDPVRAEALHSLYNFGMSEKEGLLTDLIPDEVAKEVEGKDGKKIRTIDYDLDNPDPVKKKKIDEAIERNFNNLTKDLWEVFVTHGIGKKNEDGDYEISDLDGEAYLALCRLAGFDTSKVKYVSKGKSWEEGAIGDTSNIDGIVALEGGKRLIIDHHGEYSDKNSSATKHAYDLLVKSGRLKKEPYLDRFVEFVTQHDNYYPELTKENYLNSYQTFRGLAHYMDPDDVLKLFKDGETSGVPFDPDKTLSQEWLERHICKIPGNDYGKTLLVLGNAKKFRMDQSFKSIDELGKSGFVFDSGGDFGKVLIDCGYKNKKGGNRQPKVQESYHAARFKGYGAYLRWFPESNSFVLFSHNPLGDIDLSQGKNVRGHMWMKPKKEEGEGEEELTITLQEILSKLSGKRVEVPERLRKALAKEGLDKILVDAPRGVDVLKKTGKTEKKTGIEKEVDQEKGEWMEMIIKNYSRDAKKWLKELKDGKLFTPPKNKEEEKEEIEKFIRDGLKGYNENYNVKEKFSDEEIEYMVIASMENTFSQ